MNEKKIRNKPNSNTRNNTDGRWMQMNRLNKWMNQWMTKMMMKMKWNELRASISFLYLRVCSIFYVWFDFFFKRILLSIFWSMWVKEGSQKKLWCYVLVCSIYVFLLMEHVGTWRVFFSHSDSSVGDICIHYLIKQCATAEYLKKKIRKDQGFSHFLCFVFVCVGQQ